MEHQTLHIPVTILTGFLGAGKTTFLNHLLKKNADKRYAIIENEFGEQGVDNDLIVTPDETIVELNNGCLCCTLNDNLYDILNELYERRDEFDEIIIEATGVADPTGLAEPFIAHPLVKKHFPITSIICIIDAELVEDHLEETEEARRQISFSDILFINKTDLVTSAYSQSLIDKLRALNPLGHIVLGNKNDFPEIDYKRNNDALEKMLLKHEYHHEDTVAEHFPIDKPGGHHHHDHTDLNSQSFVFDQPFDFQRLSLQLSVYFSFQSSGLYRMKGIVWLDQEDHRYVLQSVGKRYDFTKKDAWGLDQKKQSVLVFIGKNLQRTGLERILQNSLSPNFKKPNLKPSE